MIADQDSSDWQALWKAQKGETSSMKSEEICTKARAFERKMKFEFWGVPLLLALFAAKAVFYMVQFPEPWIRAGWASGIVTFIYAAARWVQVGPPRPLHNGAVGAECCADFLRAELKKKRTRILEMRWILLLSFPGMFASWWGGGPVSVAKYLGVEWPALLRFQASPGPLIGFALLLAFIWIRFGSEASAIQREIEGLQA
jgi:hypothetical protein